MIDMYQRFIDDLHHDLWRCMREKMHGNIDDIGHDVNQSNINFMLRSSLWSNLVSDVQTNIRTRSNEWSNDA